MYIKISKSPTTKRAQVYLVEGYRDGNGNVQHRTIEKYGELSELEAKDPNIIEKLKLQAKRLSEEEKEHKIVTLSIDLSTPNSECKDAKNIGYFFIEKIYNSLEIPGFLKKECQKYKFEYDINKVLQLLVYSRILQPASKIKTFENKNNFFVEFDIPKEAVYRSLCVMKKFKDNLQKHLHQKIIQQYNRDCTLVFYDVTNYYFETDVQDELRKKGVSKQHQPHPIVQMGLLIDTNNIPIGYKLFPGNTSDCKTLTPILEEIRKEFDLGKIILTADKALNSGNNLGYLANGNNGYIVSQKIRGAAKQFIKIVIEEEGYVYNKERTFKFKSFVRQRTVEYEGKEVTLNEKVVCFWSKEYDAREKYKRAEAKIKIDEMLNKPSKYKSSNSHGIKKYIKQKNLDKETGELTDSDYVLEFDDKKFNADEALDGYYALITSELELHEEEIIERYRGLWQIEDSFRVLKSDLVGRPVFVWKKDQVEGHFIICFLALLISRILEHKLGHKYSTAQIQEALNSAYCEYTEDDIYILNKYTNVFKQIQDTFGTSLDAKYASLEAIRNFRKRVLKSK